MPRFSILLPIHNDCQTISKCLQSICAQTYNDFDLLCVANNSFDGSLDKTLSLLESSSLLHEVVVAPPFINNLPKALNYGLSILAARSDYIVRMDADDVMMPDRLSRLAAFLDSQQHLPIIHGSNALSLTSFQPLLSHPAGITSISLKSQLILASPFVHPSIAIRNLPSLRYDEQYVYAQDLKLFIDYIDKGAFSYDPYPAIYYRPPAANPKKRQKQLMLHDIAINSLHQRLIKNFPLEISHLLRLKYITNEYPMKASETNVEQHFQRLLAALPQFLDGI